MPNGLNTLCNAKDLTCESSKGVPWPAPAACHFVVRAVVAEDFSNSKRTPRPLSNTELQVVQHALSQHEPAADEIPRGVLFGSVLESVGSAKGFPTINLRASPTSRRFRAKKGQAGFNDFSCQDGRNHGSPSLRPLQEPENQCPTLTYLVHLIHLDTLQSCVMCHVYMYMSMYMNMYMYMYVYMYMYMYMYVYVYVYMYMYMYM